MAELARTLIDLLNGDFVRLVTPELEVRAEVVDHSREPVTEDADIVAWEYTIEFMPVGDDAMAVPADRYRVTVEPGDDDDGWVVGELLAEVYLEDELAYEVHSRGELRSVVGFEPR